MIYYRVAFCVEQKMTIEQKVNTQKALAWKWRSTILTSPHALFTLLNAYHAVSPAHIRVFFSLSEEIMDEMLTRQNKGLVSSSLTAEQFLSHKHMSAMDVKRLEFELSTAVDYDQPYHFTLPTTLPERLAWVRLLCQVQSGALLS